MSLHEMLNRIAPGRVFASACPLLAAVANRLALVLPRERVMLIRERGQCHRNVARLVREGIAAEHWFGFGFMPAAGLKTQAGEHIPSEVDVDGWFEHSWGLRADDALIETTWPFQIYAGIQLTPAEAAELAAFQDRLTAQGRRAACR